MIRCRRCEPFCRPTLMVFKPRMSRLFGRLPRLVISRRDFCPAVTVKARSVPHARNFQFDPEQAGAGRNVKRPPILIAPSHVADPLWNFDTADVLTFW